MQFTAKNIIRPAIVAGALAAAVSLVGANLAGAAEPPQQPTVRVIPGPECWTPGYSRAAVSLPGGAATPIKARVGHHVGFDRFVVEFAEATGAPAADIALVPSYTNPPIPVPAGTNVHDRVLAIHLKGVTTGRLTGPTHIAGPKSPITFAKGADTSATDQYWLLGLTDGAPFKVTRLSNPGRLVIDVQATGVAPAAGTWGRVQQTLSSRSNPLGDADGHYTALRTGAHAGFDRVVFENTGGASPILPTVMMSCSRDAVTGEALMTLTAFGRLDPALPVGGTKIKAIEAGEVGEIGNRTWTLRLRGDRPEFRLFTLNSPKRVVIDIR